MSIDQLSLSKRTKNSLIRSNILTALDLQKLIENGTLTDIRNIGSTSVNEIQNCLISLLRDKGFHGSIDQTRIFDGESNENLLTHEELLYIIPIDILSSQLEEDLLKRLKNAHIVNMGELVDISRKVENFIQDGQTSMDSSIKLFKGKLESKIINGQLHPQSRIQGKSLDTLLFYTPENPEEKLEKLRLLIVANENSCLNDEFPSLLANIDEKKITAFVTLILRKSSAFLFCNANTGYFYSVLLA